VNAVQGLAGKQARKISIPQDFIVKYVFKPEFDAKSDENSLRSWEITSVQLRHELIQVHVGDHSSIRMGASNRNIDSQYIVPISAKFAYTPPYLTLTRSDILDSWVPNEIPSGRLSGIFCSEADCRMSVPFKVQNPERAESNLGAHNIHVSAHLRLADTPGFSGGHLGRLNSLAQSAGLPCAYNDQRERERRNSASESCIGISPEFFPPTFLWLIAAAGIIGGSFASQVAGWSQWDRGDRISGALIGVAGICLRAGGVFLLVLLADGRPVVRYIESPKRNCRRRRSP
jgi:hypothetical protein